MGFSAAPADGMPKVAAAVDYICRKKGGEGAVREIIEMILDAKVRSSSSRFEVRCSRFRKRS